jgi:hypothetical protein
VRAFIQNNPSRGSLFPADDATVSVVRGVATYNNLLIDKNGNDYTMRFKMLRNVRGTLNWVYNLIELDSPRFDVELGQPQQLVVRIPPGDAWAGGSPLGDQPEIELQDLGGNILTNDGSSIIQAWITGSLATSSSIVVNTVDAPQTVVTGVFTNHLPDLAGLYWYGVGEVIDIMVMFSQEVKVTPAANGSVPALVLATGANQAHAPCVDIGVQQRNLTFRYTVNNNEYATDLDYAAPGSSLTSSGSAILDGNFKPVNLALPALSAGEGTHRPRFGFEYLPTSLPAPGQRTNTSLAAAQDILVSDLVPHIVNVSCQLPGTGRWGAGEIVDILVYMSAPVAVQGNPRIKLEIEQCWSYNYPADCWSGDHWGARYAEYLLTDQGTNNQQLLFRYVVQSYDTTFLLKHTNSSIDMNGGWIKRFATNPTTDVDARFSTPALLGHELHDNNQLVLVTATPEVDSAIGVTTEKPAGTYSAGTIFLIDVPFTENVSVIGFPQLLLSTGYIVRPADYKSGTGTKVLTFQYQAKYPDATDDLDFINPHLQSALITNLGSVKRHVVRGTTVTDANLGLNVTFNKGMNLAANLRQSNRSDIVVDCAMVYVKSIKFTSPERSYRKGELVEMVVEFTRNVTVDTTLGLPSIEFETSDVDREAVYVSGSGSSKLQFQYQVMLGDTTADLDYLTQTSLRLKNKWQKDPKYTDGWIRRTPYHGWQLPEYPLLDVDLVLPLPARGAMGPTKIQVDTTLDGPTTILNVTTTTAPGEYGEAEVIMVYITFSDEVYIPGYAPKLKMNTGDEISYLQGVFTHVLEFVYIVPANRYIASLDIAGGSALLCNALTGHKIHNLGMTAVDPAGINCSIPSGVSLVPAGVKIDTRQPVVTKTYSINSTNPINNGKYIVGDVIYIIVEFDLPITVTPPYEQQPDKTPRLKINTGEATQAARGTLVGLDGFLILSFDGFAVYVGAGPDGHHQAMFAYTIKKGDYSMDLMYVSTTSLDNNAGQATLRRRATSPTTDCLLGLPIPQSLVSGNGTLVILDGDTLNTVPRITRVSSTASNRTYGGGDTILIDVYFDNYVNVNCFRDAYERCTRTPFLQLELGKNDRRAYWTNGTRAQMITFRYDVVEGDFSYDLDFVDRNSLQLNGGTVLHTSTVPSTPANLTLPFVGQPGSLGHSMDIQIDGLKPYITTIDAEAQYDCALWLAGLCIAGYHEVGSVLNINVRFSSPVKISQNATLNALTNQTGVTDMPHLQLFLGITPDFWREAWYHGGDGTAVLTFQYTVETGDTSVDLDYVNQYSLVVPVGTTIRRLSAVPTVDAKTWLNPAGGSLFGKASSQLAVGTVKYRDLLVDKRGKGYSMYFLTSTGQTPPNVGLYTSSNFTVIYSSEYEIMPLDRSRADRFGSAVDVHGNTTVIGAWRHEIPRYEVQTVTTSASSPRLVQEIQMIQLTAAHVDEEQAFGTTASPGGTVGGMFTISAGNYGPTREIKVNARPSQIKTVIEVDMPLLGRVSVSRSDNTFCACSNAYTWTVTFHDERGYVHSMRLTPGAGGVTGNGAYMQPRAVSRVRSPVLSGDFSLSAGHAGKNSTTIAFDALPEDVAKSLVADLGLPVLLVTRSAPDQQMGLTWSVTFHSTAAYSDMPQLIGSAQGLRGNGARVRTWTQREGAAPLAGSFKLSFRADSINGSTTAEIPHDASAALMKARLEALPSLTAVGVSREGPRADNGYTWSVTFERVRRFSEYGLEDDTVETVGTERLDLVAGNQPALVPSTWRFAQTHKDRPCNALEPNRCPPSADVPLIPVYSDPPDPASAARYPPPGPLNVEQVLSPTLRPVVYNTSASDFTGNLMNPTGWAANLSFYGEEKYLASSGLGTSLWQGDWGGYRFTTLPDDVLGMAYLQPKRFPKMGACAAHYGETYLGVDIKQEWLPPAGGSEQEAYVGGGASFTLDAPHTAYVCCANHASNRAAFGFEADGAAASEMLRTSSARGVHGLGWTEMEGHAQADSDGYAQTRADGHSVGNHTGLEQRPCTFYHKYLPTGYHQVCCESSWGSGVFLRPHVEEARRELPCVHVLHSSCTPPEEHSAMHPYHLELQNASGLLLGSHARVTVDAVSSGATSPFWEAQLRGDKGTDAGAAYIFTRSGEEWKQQQKLVGSDTDSYDRFGWAVANEGDVAAVGAPGAENFDVDDNAYMTVDDSLDTLQYYRGVYEQQYILCDAAEGSFRLKFRGVTSAPIPHNASMAQLKSHLEQMSTVHKVIVKPFPGGVCVPRPWGAATAYKWRRLVTFMGPDGAYAALEPITTWETYLTLFGDADTSLKVPAMLNVTRRVKGDERRLTRGAACGGVYMFRRNTSTFKWVQEGKLVPPDASVALNFGWSVAMSVSDVYGEEVVVGSPGDHSERGAIYLFGFDSGTKRWKMKDHFTTDVLLERTSHSMDQGARKGKDFVWEKMDRFGSAVAFDNDTIVVGAPGTNNSAGAVYVLKRDPNKVFQFDQRLHAQATAPGDNFGHAVAVSGDSAVVGAHGAHGNSTRSGVAVTFIRAQKHLWFYEEQTLYASDAHRHDRFGRSVGIDTGVDGTTGTIVVSAHEDYQGSFRPRKSVQTVRTTADAKIGGYWRAGWKERKVQSVWEYQQTTALAHDITSDALKVRLQEDLATGEVLITRTAPDETGGYSWSITFVEQPGDVTLLDVQADDDVPLRGEGADIAVFQSNAVMPKLRGNAYAYTRDTVGGRWTEQAAFVPKSKQYSEVFGWAAAVDYETAVVGAPNRDTFVSNVNGGGAFTFDLGFLNLAFSQQAYNVTEGDDISVTVHRCWRDRTQGSCHTGLNWSKVEEIVYFDSGDTVSTDPTNQLKLTKYLNQGYKGLNQLEMEHGVGMFYPSAKRWLQPRQVGTAIERGQSYGGAEQRAVHVNTQFDFVGVSDYKPVTGDLSFGVFEGAKTFQVRTTDDSLIEIPDETAMLRLSLPGIWPSHGGKLWATLTIQDDGDGMSVGPLRSWNTKLYSTDEAGTGWRSADGVTEEWPSPGHSSAGMGHSTAVDALRKLAVTGSPGKMFELAEGAGQLVQCGCAYVHALVSGVWTAQAMLLPSEGKTRNSRFGAGVAIDGYLNGSHPTRILVGAPNLAAAYVFSQRFNCSVPGMINESYTRANGSYAEVVYMGCLNGSWVWDVEAKLMAPGVVREEDGFGEVNTVALHGDYAVVGAAGAEAVYIYQYNNSFSQWTEGLRMQSSDFDYDLILNRPVLHRPQFGVAVGVSWRTVVVGAPKADYGNMGTPGVETYDTAQHGAAQGNTGYFGRGKAYVFYSVPASQTITLRNHKTADELMEGQFVLSLTHRNASGRPTQHSSFIDFNEKDTGMRAKLESMPNIDYVAVTRTGTSRAGYVWTVTFRSEVEDIPTLGVYWNGYGCPKCVPMSQIYPDVVDEKGVQRGADHQMEVNRLVEQEPWQEYWNLQVGGPAGAAACALCSSLFALLSSPASLLS